MIAREPFASPPTDRRALDPFRARWTLFVLVSTVLLSSCRLMHGYREAREVKDLATLEGTVRAKGAVAEAHTIVAVFSAREGPEMEWTLRNYTVLRRAGDFDMVVPPRGYRIWAFADLNSNYVMDPDEPRGALLDGEELEVEAMATLTGLDIVLSEPEPGPLMGPPIDVSMDADNPDLTTQAKTIGAVVGLDDERFGARFRTYGLWRPISSVQKGVLGLFMLEAYDPCRVPVLFVHGMGGSPTDLQPLIEALDRTKYQPWVMSYPASLRLHFVGAYLARAVRHLKVRHGFDEMHIVAHSMGGLIARAGLNEMKADEELDVDIPLFLTLSSPWNGHRGAVIGVEYSPVVIPSWIDIVPNSAFIEELYRTELPEPTRHHLWFGYVDGKEGDGLISTASQLDGRAQYAAAGLRGFAAGHVEILSDPGVLARFETVLEAVGGEQGFACVERIDGLELGLDRASGSSGGETQARGLTPTSSIE